MKKKELRNVPIADLVPYQKEIHNTTKSVPDIAHSLQKFNYVKTSVVVDENLQVICGQGVLKAMQEIGWKKVPEVTQVIGMPEILKREYRIADNQSGSRSKWNVEDLLKEIDEIKLEDHDFQTADIAFTQNELDQMLHDLKEEKEVEEDDFDPATIKETDIKPGDVFQLGPHRLMCADATRSEDLQQLLDGKQAHMVFTDPPYNVDYTGKTKDALKIINDHMNQAEFYQFLLQAYQRMYDGSMPGAPIYVCHSDLETITFRQSFMEAGFELKQCIIWVKDQFVLGRQDYHWRHEPILQGCKGHEPILYGWKGGKAHRWFGGRDKDTVWEVPKPLRNAEHPTMKPIALVARAVQNSSVKGNVVLDPFGGLGSTLMACEETGRVCCTGDLDPHYCQGMIDRWEQFTGKTAKKEPVLFKEG
jgi:DNA modification methylase